MRIIGSNRCSLNPKEKECLARMAKDGFADEDMEEGEISGSEVCDVIIDDNREEIDNRILETVGGDEKEEGEVEEGEIELNSVTVDTLLEEEPSEEILSDRSETDADLNQREFERRLNSVQKTLESLTVEEAKKSFSGVSSKFQTALESFHLMASENRVLAMDATVQHSSRLCFSLLMSKPLK
ncbi:hypothetical protein NE237_005231 [Protea cynaroides]|uniref:CPL3 ARM repeat domain-containing protein n=1 Tax=Protea cynaroides TaxID=273540 RepID=A0A9Q0QUE0_9MAGN|nr:hypothetical protein NE237_005231 [Protea cynaroides]